MERIPVYAVVGPTATGKSAYAVRLAQEVGGEIVSGDSMQLYRGMNVGTAKATAEEQAGIPHHLLDIADITEPFSAGQFLHLAGQAIREIAARGRVPIVCGGTGLYIELLLTGRTLTESTADAALRAELAAFAEQHGNAALHERLRALDPAAAEAIHPNNVKRVIRAIEICTNSGITKSEADLRSREAENPFLPTIIRLTCTDRAALYRRIDRRVASMFADGLEQEVRGLCARGLRETPTASQAIGYKEFYPYLDGRCSLADVQAEIGKHTRQYAKRQETWFSRMHTDRTIAVDDAIGKDVDRQL